MEYREIEVRFLEIDKDALIAKLRELGAEDLGEDLLDEKIIYDKELTWRDGVKKLLRMRTQKGRTMLTYKHRVEMSAEGTEEIEFEVQDTVAAQALLERLGYEMYRAQQKMRHSFHLGEVIVDIDTWPKIPTYVELEGPSVEALQEAAVLLGLDWKYVELRNPRRIIEDDYGIPVGNMRWFTFDKFE
jgi:adenylate cyclase class 2